MSALANILSSHRVEPHLSESESLSAMNQTSSSDISDISVTTRIDYNLRFTKQAVLVVADNTAQYSQIASQYLVSLSNTAENGSEANDSQINVAFVSASTKLNDIQIRCRLVEQLFVNTLFDPEQSLAVSVLKFAKQHGEAISIIVDHAHALSLQIKYELCQLVDQAKKHNLRVNVVIFGLAETAHQLSINKSLFKSKIVIIDAESGQIISFDDNKIKPQKNKVTLTLLQKLSLFTVILVLVALLVWGYQLIMQSIDSQHSAGTAHTIPRVLNTDDTTSLSRVMVKKEKDVVVENNSTPIESEQATSSEISSAILSLSSPQQEDVAPAEASDVINALGLAENADEQLAAISEQGFTENSPLLTSVTINKSLPRNVMEIDNNYYKNQMIVHDAGYVIQIAGFADKKLWQRFIKENSTQDLFSYQRLLKEQSFVVVTSKVYPDKAAAKAALSLLPESLSSRKPWLKEISAVINEINTFKR